MGTFKVKSVSTGREGEGSRGKEENGRGEGRGGNRSGEGGKYHVLSASLNFT